MGYIGPPPPAKYQPLQTQSESRDIVSPWWIIPFLFSLLLCSPALATNPVPTGLVVDRVDVIEVNYHYDDDAELRFVQTLYLEWKHSRHNCQAWRLARGATVEHTKPGICPNYDYARKEWRATWFDAGVLRQVQSPHARWTHTQTEDPEIADKKRFPECYRRDLCKE